jgi:hypothetical protein
LTGCGDFSILSFEVLVTIEDIAELRIRPACWRDSFPSREDCLKRTDSH